MTPSDRAKELGCKSLAQVYKTLGQSEQTIINWFKSRPLVFDAICEYTAKKNRASAMKILLVEGPNINYWEPILKEGEADLSNVKNDDARTIVRAFCRHQRNGATIRVNNIQYRIIETL